MFRIGFPVPAGAVIVSAMLCFSAPVLADSETAGPSPAEVQKVEEQNPKICKRFKPTGSNISKTYCFRKSTWDAMREDSQQALRDLNDRSSVNTGSSEGRR
jgi:hypothetical protein